MDLTPALQRIHALVDGLIAMLPGAALAFLIMLLSYAIAKRAGILVRQFSTQRWPRGTVALVFGRLLKWAILLFGLLVALSVTFPTLTARDIIQFLGIGTVAIGFAFRDVLQNFLAGIILLITHPFRIGDEIAMDNVEGIVQEIETRATLVKTYDGSLVVIPNASILTRNVEVNTAYQARRAVLEFELDQDVDIQLARRSIIDGISSVNAVLKEPSPRARVRDLASGNWKVRATWWTPSSRQEWLGAKDQVIPAIVDRLRDSGIELPSDPLDSVAEAISSRPEPALETTHERSSMTSTN